MVLDRRPDRVVSTAWRQLMHALPHGVYATHPGEGETLAVLQRALVPAGAGALGLDLEKTRTLVSFGAPVLDGWGRPGRMLAARKGLRVVQVDTWRSPSAALADEWVEIPPGAEGPLALALAHVIVSEQATPAGEDVRLALAGFSPDRARVAHRPSPRRGSRRSPARSSGSRRPSRSAAATPAPAPSLGTRSGRSHSSTSCWAAWAAKAGSCRAAPCPEAADDAARTGPTPLADVPDGSVGVLFLDAADDGRALPWPLLRRTLAKDAVVVSLSPFDGTLAREADVLVPAPAPLEAWDEVLPTADATVASYGVSAPVLPAPPGATDTVAFLQGLASALEVEVGKATHEERLRERVAAIHAADRGRVVARADDGYAEQAAADASAFWEALVAGGCWIDDGQDGRAARGQRAVAVHGLARALEPAAGRAGGPAASSPSPRAARPARRRLAAAHQALPGVGPARRGHGRGDEPEHGRAARPRRPAAACGSRARRAASGPSCGSTRCCRPGGSRSPPGPTRPRSTRERAARPAAPCRSRWPRPTAPGVRPACGSRRPEP